MPAHPSKQQQKRAEFVGTDLVDAVEAYLAATDKQWVDAGPAKEARDRMNQLVKYARTGETDYYYGNKR